MKQFVAIVMLAASSVVSAQAVPAFVSTSLSGVSLPAPLQTKPTFQPFFSNRTNQALVAGEMTVRLLDAVSTRQSLTNHCKCMVEVGTLYGMSLKAVAQSDWTQYSYSIGMASCQIVLADRLWSHASQSRYPKVFHFASRAVLAFDTSSDVYGPINNWTAIPKGSR